MSTWTMARALTSALRRRRRRPGRERRATPTAPASLDGLPLDVPAERRELTLQDADPLDQLLHGARDGIGQIGLVQIDLSLHAASVPMGDPTGHADHDGVGRDLSDDHGSRADAAAITDHEGPDDLGPRSHDD